MEPCAAGKSPLTLLQQADLASTAEILARRARLSVPNVSTFYDEPVHPVRGEGVWVWDAEGRKYLDCCNNVPHIGHCHPHVAEAICRQASTLNIHTRYLHEGCWIMSSG